MLDIEAAQGTTDISSARLSRLSGFSAPQVRRDLAYFGSFGKRGVGYSVRGLRDAIGTILGMDQPMNLAMVGVGNLGRALLAYRGFARQDSQFVVAFDADARKIGSTVAGVSVEPVGKMGRLLREHDVRLAIIAVPATQAQDVLDDLVGAGIKAILNFAPRVLEAPDDVMVSNVDLAVEVEYLSYSLANR
jgi:redox-sensing transcriptional repressor